MISIIIIIIISIIIVVAAYTEGAASNLVNIYA